MFLLDTNVCSAIVRRSPSTLFDRYAGLRAGEAAISAIVYAEIQYGRTKRPLGRVRETIVARVLATLEVLPWTQVAAEHYADIRAGLEREGTPIGAMDMLIAAHARSADATLVTLNHREFARVPGLRVESWS
ncbi:PIN domain-containing protein [Parapedomonas caeni]